MTNKKKSSIESKSRRGALKKTSASAIAVAAASQAPSNWTKPIVNSVITPAHAEMSIGGGGDETGGTTVAPTTAEPTTVAPTSTFPIVTSTFPVVTSTFPIVTTCNFTTCFPIAQRPV